MAQARRKKRPVKTPEESWAQIFDDWRQTGLSAEEYCERNNYSLWGFTHFYEKQFGAKPPSGDGKTNAPGAEDAEALFVPLGVLTSQHMHTQAGAAKGNGKIEISSRNQSFVVHVPEGFNPVALRQVLEVLGGMRC